MDGYGVFDIIGPIMIGPSSSHTAGAVRLALMARKLCGGRAVHVCFELHGSFAETGKGHGSDKALVAGMLGISYGDNRLKEAFEIANRQKLTYEFKKVDLGNVHPNTVRFVITTDAGARFTMTGSSIGGGAVVISEIDGVACSLGAEVPILLTWHKDEPGVVAGISTLLYQCHVNIGNMEVFRKDDGRASMYMELSGNVQGEYLRKQLAQIDGIEKYLVLDPAESVI